MVDHPLLTYSILITVFNPDYHNLSRSSECKHLDVATSSSSFAPVVHIPIFRMVSCFYVNETFLFDMLMKLMHMTLPEPQPSREGTDHALVDDRSVPAAAPAKRRLSDETAANECTTVYSKRLRSRISNHEEDKKAVTPAAIEQTLAIDDSVVQMDSAIAAPESLTTAFLSSAPDAEKERVELSQLEIQPEQPQPPNLDSTLATTESSSLLSVSAEGSGGSTGKAVVSTGGRPVTPPSPDNSSTENVFLQDEQQQLEGEEPTIEPCTVEVMAEE